jgi:hypothetical protein
MRDLKIKIVSVGGVLVTSARSAPLTSTIICKITNNFIETLSAVKQRDTGLFDTDILMPSSFALGQRHSFMPVNTLIDRLDELSDVVEGATPPNGGVLTYDATDDKYYVRELPIVPPEPADLDGGSF